MFKINKETLNALLLIIFVLLLALIFVLTEAISNIRSLSNVDIEEVASSTLDSLYENIKYAPKNTDPSTVRKCLTEIFDLMNNKKYEKLYTLLTEDIKDFSFPTQNDFNNYMENYLKGEKYSPSFSNYKKLNKENTDVFIITVDFLPYSTNESDITTTKSPSLSDTFTIYMDESSNYKFSFKSFIGTGKSNSVFEDEAICCKLLKTHLSTSQTIFDIEIKNKTDKDIIIDKEGIWVTVGVMPKHYSSPVRIPANSSTNLSFTIYTGLNLKSSLPKRVSFKGVRIEDKVYIFHLPIKYPIKLFETYG